MNRAIASGEFGFVSKHGNCPCLETSGERFDGASARITEKCNNSEKFGEAEYQESVCSQPIETISMKVAVLGGGPAGLAASRYLRQHNADVEVLERGNRFGGLLESHNFAGHEYDVGTILFFEKHGMLTAFPELREHMVQMSYLPRSVNPAGNIDKYPLTIEGYIKAQGKLAFLRSLVELVPSKIINFRKDTVAAFACYYMGPSIYVKSGLKNYIQRLHEMSDDTLHVDFARQRLGMIERFSIRNTLKRAIGIQKNRKKIGQKRLVRPAQGFAFMFDHICSLLREEGVSLKADTKIERIEKDGDVFLIHTSDGLERYDAVVSTIPMQECCKLCGIEPFHSPRTKTLLSMYFTGTVLPPGNTFFNFTFEGRWKRMTVFSRYYANESEKDWFTVEVTTDDASEETMKRSADEYMNHARKHKLIDADVEMVGHSISEDAYPVFSREVKAQVDEDRNKLNEFGINLLGRQGNFEYVISNVVARKASFLAGEVVEKA